MEKELYKNVEVESEGFELAYYLLENENNLGYGVAIEKISNTNVEESREIYDICSQKDELCEFLEKITKANVTPITLDDVVIDWIE